METMSYGPETPERTHRLASLAGAIHFGTEGVKSIPLAGDDTDEVVVYEVVGQHPKGWDIFGRDVIVTIVDETDGSVGAVITDEDMRTTYMNLGNV